MELKPEVIERLKNDSDFQQYLKVVFAGIAEPATKVDLEALPNDRAGEEAKIEIKVQKRLYGLLFTPLTELKEIKEPSAEQIDKAKKKFGL